MNYIHHDIKVLPHDYPLTMLVLCFHLLKNDFVSKCHKIGLAPLPLAGAKCKGINTVCSNRDRRQQVAIYKKRVFCSYVVDNLFILAKTLSKHATSSRTNIEETHYPWCPRTMRVMCDCFYNQKEEQLIRMSLQKH